MGGGDEAEGGGVGGVLALCEFAFIMKKVLTCACMCNYI